MNTKTLFVGAMMLGLLTGLSGCASVTSPYTYQGAAAGGALGAVTGALIDGNNRWRGAVIGGALGSAMGAATTEISARSARQAVSHHQPVYYPRNGEREYHGERDYHRDHYSRW